HELRNPLAPLRIGLEVLRIAGGNGREGEEGSHTREVMERQGEHLSRLIDDLLDMSRITHGRIELREGRANPATASEHPLGACRPSREAAGHKLTLDLPAEPIAVNGDPVRIIQVVENLLTNAIKYSPRQSQITVILERDGDEAVLRVRDTGDGIASDLL